MIEAKEGRVSHNLFSLCYGHDGGYLTIGPYDESRHVNGTTIETFTFDGSQGQYKITLNKIKVYNL